MARSNTLHGTARATTIAALLLATALQSTAQARDPGAASATLSEASAASAFVVGSVVVAGSLVALGTAGSAVVASVQAVGQGTVIVLRGLSDASTATVRVAGGASVVVGSVIEVVALGTGCALVQAGRMIAFVPNELGRSLVHRHGDASVR